MKGTLVCFEGLDCSGKTTIVQKLLEILNFEEVKCVSFSFPNTLGPAWNVIQSYQREFIDMEPHAAHLLYSANRWGMQEAIIKYLDSGYVVLLDRYFYSGIAYSCGYAGLDLTWACNVESGLLCPDIVFYMNTNKEIRQSRLNILNSADRFDTMKIQDKVEAVYKKLITDTWIIVNGDVKEDEICEFCCLHLTPLIQKEYINL